MVYLDLLILSTFMCFVIDVSGFIEEVEAMLSKWLKTPFLKIPKPLSCALCMTFWCGLFYICVTGNFNAFTFGYVFLLSMMTPVITNVLYLVRNGLNKLVDIISRLFGL